MTIRGIDVNGSTIVPGDAGTRAALVSLTVTRQAGSGYLTAYPCGEARPNTSVLNYRAGGPTVTGSAIIGFGDQDCINVYLASSAAHVIVDVQGYLHDLSTVEVGVIGALGDDPNAMTTPEDFAELDISAEDLREASDPTWTPPADSPSYEVDPAEAAADELAAGPPSTSPADAEYDAYDVSEATESAKGPTVQAIDYIDANHTVGTWKDGSGRFVRLRRGYYTSPSLGFGLAKVEGKHNLTAGVVKTATKYYLQRSFLGTTRVYRTKVYKLSCYNWTPFFCRKIDSYWVRVVYGGNNLADNRHKGVITAYCEGVIWCPSWVRNSVNVSWS
ncbi:MAG: hypothetical protein ACRCY9_07105 [Phycicoccus sp.]